MHGEAGRGHMYTVDVWQSLAGHHLKYGRCYRYRSYQGVAVVVPCQCPWFVNGPVCAVGSRPLVSDRKCSALLAWLAAIG
jgi:hypothetical protein